MAKPVLIIMHGAPGTGKTTLSRKLAKDLSLPCIGKDDIKELLFDKMGVGDKKWSQDLGAAVAGMLFVLVETFTGRKRSLIAESAYYRSFAVPRFELLIKSGEVAFLEIYCRTDPEVRKQRFIVRNESGNRHPGHVDYNYYADTDEDVETEYAPLRIGGIIEVDTTTFDKAAYQALVAEVRAFIDTNNRRET